MKDNKITKLLPLLIAVIGVIGIILFARVISAGEQVETDVAVQNSVVSPLVSFSYYLLVIVVIVSVILSLLGLFKNPAALKKTLIGLAVLGVLLAISYFTASDAAVYDAQGTMLKDGAAGSVSKWVGAGITYSLILGAVGFFFFVFDLLKGLIKS